jgi:hypothetical protein
MIESAKLFDGLFDECFDVVLSCDISDLSDDVTTRNGLNVINRFFETMSVATVDDDIDTLFGKRFRGRLTQSTAGRYEQCCVSIEIKIHTVL